ncbi:hypothetical protein DICPUDRAFT_84714 [Dictyostelium purpureum]|uniref:Uncharacterized protein n=1 Tax=Dictyostelium purpureum TaxID=5786 RepID=F1A3I7_DICPU|nr:uncharacterized protein DICPUDRAFT_84714 [Dictyostelium purpureum]EGC29248.1 hypothetical protein DICPUDRAFT_84714 [Dictyostelium purpureum]|eukprot:XP_003294231.1 hypothetical protein DICPUDRAFT_84714 [Dictyostelium purpureum]
MEYEIKQQVHANQYSIYQTTPYNSYLLNNINYLKVIKNKSILYARFQQYREINYQSSYNMASKYSYQIILKLHPFITRLKTSSNTQQQHSSEERNQNIKRFDVWSFMFPSSLLKLLSSHLTLSSLDLFKTVAINN